MISLINRLNKPASPVTIQYAHCFMRIGLGILTLLHGIPKMMGGVAVWENLGVTFMPVVGIYFLPIVWGFLGACIEFFGGIAFITGIGTRIASVFLTIMMIIATLWHIHNGDPFNIYSFPLTLIVIFLAYTVIGKSKG